jgi:hypothetical protein
LCFRQFAQLIQAHGIQALEDIAVFAMQWGAAVGLIEALNVLEAGDDAFFGFEGLVLSVGTSPQRIQQVVIVHFSHWRIPLRRFGLGAVACQRGHTFSHAFSQASAELMSGRRPRSF